MGRGRGMGRSAAWTGAVVAAVIAVGGCENAPPPTSNAAAGSGQSSSRPTIARSVPSATGAPEGATGVPRTGTATRKPAAGTTPAPSRTGAAASGGQEVAHEQVTVTGEVGKVEQASATVRTSAGTTTVSWDGGTPVLDTRPAKRSDVRKGACVVGSTPLVAPGEQRTGAAGADEVVWVLVSPPLDGRCATVAAQAPGASGAARIVSGLVTGVEGSVVTLETVGVGRPTAMVRFALASQASVVRTVEASAGAVRQGRCIVVEGARDAAGHLIATSVTLSDKVGKSCST